MAVKVEGTQRGGPARGGEKAVETTPSGDQFVAAGLPPYAELTRQGGGYSVIAISALVGLVVRPSTTAQITLWNGEGTGGKSYVIDRLFTHNLVSTAALSFYSLWATVHPSGMTNPGVDIARSATNITGNSGKKYNGMAVVGVAESVDDNGWYPWATSTEVTTAGVVPGSHLSVDVEGRLIVPPQGGISLTNVCSIASTVTFCTGLSWYEMQLDLE